MAKTSIEWADHSINPFRARNIETGAIGHFCVKISGGCKFCYASKMQNPYLTQLEYTAENRPKVELFLEEKALDEVLRRRKPTRYFWCDMTDMFLADYPDEWIDRCFTVMVATPWHTHMILTKRADRMMEYFASGRHDGGVGPDRATYHLDQHIWLGVSVEDRANLKRVELLRQTPAAVRFLSLEPLLEDLGELDLRGISWCIVGGESGPCARPMDTAWARSIVRQCKAAGVACFVKQLGAKPVIGETWASEQAEWPEHVLDASGVEEDSRCNELIQDVKLRDRKGGDMAEWPVDLQVREMPMERNHDCI